MFLFFDFIILVIAQRLSELYVARRNEKWIIKQGGVEYGKEHYPYMVALHTLFIISIFAEFNFTTHNYFYPWLAVIWLVLIVIKAWVINSLGKYWNTKIIRVPNVPLVSKGLYKYIKHPNYVIVVLEIIVIPMVFNLYYTAIVFTILNAAMLYVRIKAENKALGYSRP